MLKRKFSKLVCLLTLPIIVLTGCSSTDGSGDNSADGKGVNIAGIYKAGDQVWFIDEANSVKSKLGELDANAKFTNIDAKMNPDTYLQAIDNVITQKVDGVITCIPDQKLSQATVQKLNDAGIPVLAVDDPLTDANGTFLAPWAGIDSYEIGKQNGLWMGDYILDNKLESDPEAAVLILTMDTVSSCVPRTDGELDGLKEKIPTYDDKKIFKADYNGETDKGFTAASAIITANPNIKKWMIMGANEEGVIGSARALEQAGLDKDSCVIGLGGYLAKDEFKKEYSCVKAATYFSSKQLGELSAQLMYDKVVNGKDIPEKSTIEATVVTKDNYKEVMGDDAN